MNGENLSAGIGLKGENLSARIGMNGENLLAGIGLKGEKSADRYRSGMEKSRISGCTLPQQRMTKNELGSLYMLHKRDVRPIINLIGIFH